LIGLTLTLKETKKEGHVWCTEQTTLKHQMSLFLQEEHRKMKCDCFRKRKRSIVVLQLLQILKNQYCA